MNKEILFENVQISELQPIIKYSEYKQTINETERLDNIIENYSMYLDKIFDSLEFNRNCNVIIIDAQTSEESYKILINNKKICILENEFFEDIESSEFVFNNIYESSGGSKKDSSGVIEWITTMGTNLWKAFGESKLVFFGTILEILGAVIMAVPVLGALGALPMAIGGILHIIHGYKEVEHGLHEFKDVKFNEKEFKKSVTLIWEKLTEGTPSPLFYISMGSLAVILGLFGLGTTIQKGVVALTGAGVASLVQSASELGIKETLKTVVNQFVFSITKQWKQILTSFLNSPLAKKAAIHTLEHTLLTLGKLILCGLIGQLAPEILSVIKFLANGIGAVIKFIKDLPNFIINKLIELKESLYKSGSYILWAMFKTILSQKEQIIQGSNILISKYFNPVFEKVKTTLNDFNNDMETITGVLKSSSVKKTPINIDKVKAENKNIDSYKQTFKGFDKNPGSKKILSKVKKVMVKEEEIFENEIPDFDKYLETKYNFS